MPSCNTYHLTWVPSYLGHGVSLNGCSSKVQPVLLTLHEGYLLTTTLPDLQRGIAPLGPPAPAQPLLLGHGVGPPGRCSWPRAWGWSSRPPPLVSGMGCSSWLPPLTSGVGALLSAVVPGLGLRGVGYLLSAAPPELGHGVAPLGRTCAVAVWYSQPLPLTSTVG